MTDTEHPDLRERVAKVVEWCVKRSRGTPAKQIEDIVRFGSDRILSLIPDASQPSETEALREALEPFAKAADGYDWVRADEADHIGIITNSASGHKVNVGDFRRARSALNALPADGESRSAVADVAGAVFDRSPGDARCQSEGGA